MRSHHSAAFAAASAFAMTGCAEAQLRPSDAAIVVEPSPVLKIDDVVLTEGRSTLLVRGKVTRRTMARGKVWGHLHLEAWDARGRLLTSKDVSLWRVRKDRTPAPFNVTLPVLSKQVQEVRLSHVINSDRSRAAQETN